MEHTGAADGGNEVFSTTTPLPVAGPVGYTVRVLPHHPLLAGDNELDHTERSYTTAGRMA